MNKIQQSFHKSRRKELSGLIGKDSIAVIFGNTLRNKSYDGDFLFKQYKNFYYLTGFTEANSALLIAPGGITLKSGSKKINAKEVLYVQPKDEKMETWNGKRLGYNNVKKELGIEYSEVNEKISRILSYHVLKNYRRVYLNIAEILKLTGDMKRII